VVWHPIGDFASRKPADLNETLRSFGGELVGARRRPAVRLVDVRDADLLQPLLRRVAADHREDDVVREIFAAAVAAFVATILTSGGLLFGLGAGRFLGIGRRAMVVFSFQIVRALPNIGSLSDIMPQLRHKSWV